MKAFRFREKCFPALLIFEILSIMTWPFSRWSWLGKKCSLCVCSPSCLFPAFPSFSPPCIIASGSQTPNSGSASPPSRNGTHSPRLPQIPLMFTTATATTTITTNGPQSPRVFSCSCSEVYLSHTYIKTSKREVGGCLSVSKSALLDQQRLFEGPQKHLSLHTPTKTLSGPHVH